MACVVFRKHWEHHQQHLFSRLSPKLPNKSPTHVATVSSNIQHICLCCGLQPKAKSSHLYTSSGSGRQQRQQQRHCEAGVGSVKAHTRRYLDYCWARTIFWNISLRYSICRTRSQTVLKPSCVSDVLAIPQIPSCVGNVAKACKSQIPTQGLFWTLPGR